MSEFPGVYPPKGFQKEEGPMGLSSLGNKVTEFSGTLESFEAPTGLENVTLECSEVTGFCPVTNQPDFYVITIYYQPRQKCIESKSLKLYLQTFRNRGIFCEALSVEIAEKIKEDIQPSYVSVRVKQSPRGGIGITAFSDLYPRLEEPPYVPGR